MGRINLTPLRVRKRALGHLESNRNQVKPTWLDVIGDIPPAQIFTRQQPIPHPFTQIRTRNLPNGKTQQFALASPSKKSKNSKASRLFAPVRIKYEEDQLRKQFFSDHPWELARPRIVVETTGDQYKNADWSTGLAQRGIPISGESVVQRQLWLLNNVPDMTVDSSYDIARKEFYTHRRQEATRRRVLSEEALHMGAQPEKGALQWSMDVESKHYNEWAEWARSEMMGLIQKNAAFSGEVSPAEQTILKDDARSEQEQDQTQSQTQAQGVANDRIGQSIPGTRRMPGRDREARGGLRIRTTPV